ncbi:MAG: hypothetical protein MUP44_13025 [Anaerolineales bacterium]|nr:hypothetical protein [Anaerolineales bacterium]
MRHIITNQGSEKRLCRFPAAFITACALLLASCSSERPDPTPTPIPTLPAPTPTVFFPTLIPTPTFTPEPTPSSTPDIASGLGMIVFLDDFSQDQGWNPLHSNLGGSSLYDGRFSLSVSQANSFYTALSPVQEFTDGYLEVMVQAVLCTDEDEFGLMFRVDPSGGHYRFTLTCKGEARVTRVFEGSEVAVIPKTITNALIPGLLVDNRLGIIAEGDRFRFFLNGDEVFSAHDLGLRWGGLGLIVHARRGGQTTASFDNFIVRALLPTPTATHTPTP